MKRFAQATENVRQKDATTLDEVKKFVQKQLVPALQLQYGERWQSGDGRYLTSGGVKEFIKDMTENIQDAVDAVECGDKGLYKLLFTYTLPNIINQHIENAAIDGDRLHFFGNGDDGDLQVSHSQIVRTALAFRDFHNKKAAALMANAVGGFKKILARQQKKGNIRSMRT